MNSSFLRHRPKSVGLNFSGMLLKLGQRPGWDDPSMQAMIQRFIVAFQNNKGDMSPVLAYDLTWYCSSKIGLITNPSSCISPFAQSTKSSKQASALPNGFEFPTIMNPVDMADMILSGECALERVDESQLVETCNEPLLSAKEQQPKRSRTWRSH